MNLTSIFTQKTFSRVAWGAVIIALLFSAISIFAIGGDDLVISLGDILPIPLSILTTLAAYFLWRTYSPGTASRKLWTWLLLGWGLWAIGEILYVVYAFITDDIPYPSVADFAYILGTTILVIGLFIRLNQQLRKLTTVQEIIFWLILIGSVVGVYTLVLAPILADYAETGLLETFINVFYPVTDLIMFVIGVRLVFDYTERHVSSFGWVLVVIGFMLVTVADLVYTYSYYYGLYFPDGKVNLLSTLGSSIPYTLAYFLWVLGLYRLQIKETGVEAEQTIAQPACVENTHIVFFVNRDLLVDEVSANAWVLQTGGLPPGSDMVKMLGLKSEDRQAIIGALTRDGVVTDMPLDIRNMRNELVSAKLNGLRLLDPQRNIIGALLVVRVLSSTNDMDAKLSEYQVSIAKQVKRKSGSNEDKLACKFLAEYTYPLIKHYQQMAFHHGGPQQGLVFIENLNQKAEAENWGVKVTESGIAYSETTEPQTLVARLNQLKGAAEEQLRRMTDEKTITAGAAALNSHFTSEVKDCLEYVLREYADKPAEK